MRTLKEKCQDMKIDHPTWGYKRIAKELGCVSNTVKYHLCPEAKKKSFARVNRSRLSNPLRRKLQDFGVDFKWHMRVKQMNRGVPVKVTLEALTAMIGDNPKCYLTGRKIDLSLSRSYHLDHKLPKSKGGNNSANNIGLACREANQAKNDMTPQEFFLFCKEVLEFNGFDVKPKMENLVEICTHDGLSAQV